MVDTEPILLGDPPAKSKFLQKSFVALVLKKKFLRLIFKSGT